MIYTGTPKYFKTTTAAPERKHKTVTRTLKCARLNHRIVLGMKGPSSVLKLTGLDLVWEILQNYMNCVLDDVTKQLTELWLISTGICFYVAKSLEDLADRLSKIRPPPPVSFRGL